MIPKRIELFESKDLLSIYPVKSKNKLDISCFNNKGQMGNFIVPELFDALLKLDKLVRLNKGTMYIIDLYRSWECQAEAREKFENKTKRAFVSKPGESFHNAGRAADISMKDLNFEEINKDKWVSMFWDLAKPLGFYPIITIPDLGASEVWHYDFPGNSWQDAYNVLQYSEVAKCCTLDIGGWDLNENEEKVRKMFIQSQLIRLGFYEIGKVDGIIGPKTQKVLDFCNVGEFDTKVIADMLSHRDP